MRNYLIPIILSFALLIGSCHATGSDEIDLDVRTLLKNSFWYDFNIEQNLFPGDVLERYTFSNSEVTIDLFPMPCGLGTSLEPIVTFHEDYSIDDERALSIGDVAYEVISVSENEIVLSYENKTGKQVKKLTNGC